MTCPFCGHIEDRVIDSRESREGDSIRRRRQCLGCEKRFTTYERIDEVPYMVIKKDGRREKFDRQKVLNGLLKACEKRPISMAKLSDLVNQVEARVTDSPDREITTTEIGEYLMDSLRGVDKIAYVRFASVYRDFQDEQAFLNELQKFDAPIAWGTWRLILTAASITKFKKLSWSCFQLLTQPSDLALPFPRVLLQPGRRCTPRRFLTVISLRRERRITAVLDFRLGALLEIHRAGRPSDRSGNIRVRGESYPRLAAHAGTREPTHRARRVKGLAIQRAQCLRFDVVQTCWRQENARR